MLQHSEHEDLVMALKSAGKGVMATIMSAMSDRRKQLLLDDLNALPPTRFKDVELAQLRILQHVRRLEEPQLSKLARSDKDDTYV